jgi:hypothetical protein
MAHFSWHKKSDGDAATQSRRVKRLALVKVDDLMNGKRIPIMRYITTARPALSAELLIPVQDLHGGAATVPTAEYFASVLWKSSFTLLKRNDRLEWMNWSGFMQHVHKTDITNQDESKLLPIIDLNPNDEDCIFSTLSYVSDQARRLGIPSTTITFDQPLFIKGCEVAASKGMTNLVIRLGGFHLLMSAIGSLYATMRGSGVKEALGQIYATNTLPLLLLGKAISRAMRGTRLLDAALHHKLLEKLHTVGDTDDGDHEVEGIINDVSTLMESVNNPDTENPMDIIDRSSTLVSRDEKIAAYKENLSSRSRTAKLSVQFLMYIQIVHDFIHQNEPEIGMDI